MSQVFAADSVNNLTATTVTTTTETLGAIGNFVNPPFQNAKAVIMGCMSVALGTGTTAVNTKIRRNPNAENIVVGGNVTQTDAGGNTVILNLQLADPIPDGRPVQYVMTVQQLGATGNGSIGFSNITTLLISG